MHHADADARQGATELVGSRLGRLDVERVAFLNGRAHPVGLTTVLAGGPDASDHGLAACAVNQGCCHRLSARRQFINDGTVEIAVGHHGQRSWNGRGSQRQLMWVLAVGAFIGERQSLMDAESMLFIDNNESQPLEHDIVLK